MLNTTWDRSSEATSASLLPNGISLVVINDNTLVREGVALLLRSQPGFRVLAASADVDEAMDEVRDAQPDVVLVDTALGRQVCLHLVSVVRDQLPYSRVIVMGVPSGDSVAEYVLAGASGFMMQHASFDECFATIRTVAAGGRVLPPALTESLFSQLMHHPIRRDNRVARANPRLTAREREVVELLAEGLSNRDIGTRLNITVHTVKSHVHNLLEKLALRTRLEIAAFSHSVAAFPDS